MSSARGIARERAVRRLLEDLGWVVSRCAGSKGAYDLHASKAGENTWLIEVKSTARGPYHGFGPDDRKDLLAAAGRAGAVAMLCWWPPHARAEWLHSDLWPDRNRTGEEREDGGSKH